MVLRAQNNLVALEVQAAVGTEETITPADDAFSVENARMTFDPQITQTNEGSGSLDRSAPIIGGMKAGINFDVIGRASGTAGTPPPYGDALVCCAMSEIITATAVPASPEALAAGGSQVMAVLGASASTTAQIYRGMPLDLTGAVQDLVTIWDYDTSKNAKITKDVGASLIATTSYQVLPNVLYRPASTSLKVCTIHFWRDGRKFRLKDCKGTVSTTFTAAGVLRLSFQFRGVLVADPEDEAVPSVTITNATTPIWKGGLSRLDGKIIKVNTLTLNDGITLADPDNPENNEGFDPPEATAREWGGQIDPSATLVATRNALAEVRAGGTHNMAALLGSTAGNRIACTVPAAQFTGYEEPDREGIVVDQTPYRATGADSGAFLCFF
ncbi:MAG: hypothetical protein MI755_16305 [Sphingomonadales bacterium]|nr:hypothetical protein [Sphingomonadales bacterium]